MKKEEIVAMVGKENIGSWWTSGRIIVIVLLSLIILMMVRGFISDRLPGVLPILVVIGFLVFLVGLMIFCLVWGFTRGVFSTCLKVEKINKTGTETEVLGKDGKRHTLELCHGIHLNKDQKTSFARISGYLNSLWVDVTVGQDMNQIWK